MIDAECAEGTRGVVLCGARWVMGGVLDRVPHLYCAFYATVSVLPPAQHARRSHDADATAYVTELAPTTPTSPPIAPLCSLDVGGKLLTGHLKELLSYRQYNVMDDTALVNTVSVCWG